VTEGKERRGREERGKKRGEKEREGKEKGVGSGPAGRQVPEVPHWQKTTVIAAVRHLEFSYSTWSCDCYRASNLLLDYAPKFIKIE